jgi:hypothetical protein
MRFLGRKSGPTHPAFTSEVVSDVRTREEGVRIKHRIASNSVKAYDKAYTSEAAVLRIETTINDETDFKAYRPKEGDPDGPCSWRTLRRGVADLPCRAQLSQACNERYLDALAAFDDDVTLDELAGTVTVRTRWKGKSVRALQPFERQDARMLEIVSRGEFAINGIRNRDVQALLFGPEPAQTPHEAKSRSAKVTRMLRLLRAHAILHKIPNTNRYQLTQPGRQLTTALAAAKHMPINQLLRAA